MEVSTIRIKAPEIEARDEDGEGLEEVADPVSWESVGSKKALKK